MCEPAPSARLARSKVLGRHPRPLPAFTPIPTFLRPIYPLPRYKSSKLRFATVDLAQWPELGERFTIDTSGTSWQLPTLMMFEAAKESSRLPPLKPDGTVEKVKIDSEGIRAYFKLDQRMLRARDGR